MIERSHKNNRSPWEALFNACRSAIRSPAGLSVAEFLFPSLVVDLLCFGPSDEIVIQELAKLLSLLANSRYLKMWRIYHYAFIIIVQIIMVGFNADSVRQDIF